MVHTYHRKKTPGGCIERLARSGSCRESVRGVVGTMNAARSRPDWLATVQSGRKQAYTNTIPVLGGFFDVQFRSLGFIQSLINIVLVTALGFSIKVLK